MDSEGVWRYLAGGRRKRLQIERVSGTVRIRNHTSRDICELTFLGERSRVGFRPMTEPSFRGMTAVGAEYVVRSAVSSVRTKPTSFWYWFRRWIAGGWSN